MSAKAFVDTNILAGSPGVLRGCDGEKRDAAPESFGPARSWTVIWSGASTLRRAEIAAVFRIEDEAGIGFWDALIVAAARKAGAARILSEDLNPGQIIAGVQVENPFSTQQATSYE